MNDKITEIKNHFEIKGDIVEIYVKRGNGDQIVTIIDADDLEKVNSKFISLYAQHDKTTNSFYIYGRTHDAGIQYLHRIITDCPKGIVVDHINHDTLTNCKYNLRNVPQSVNMLNRKGLDKNNTSGVRGVGWHDHSQTWRVQYIPEFPEWNEKGKCHKRIAKYFEDLEDAKEFIENINRKRQAV